MTGGDSGLHLVLQTLPGAEVSWENVTAGEEAAALMGEYMIVHDDGWDEEEAE